MTIYRRLGFAVAACFALHAIGYAQEGEDDAYNYRKGDLMGSLKSDRPLPIYDGDANHLWNRLFSCLYTRESNLPSEPGGQPVKRFEGGDWTDFLGWASTTYWSEPEPNARLQKLLDEFQTTHGERSIEDPLRRAILQRDLWAAYDFLMAQNMERFGTLEDQRRRAATCRKLAHAIRALALPQKAIAALPDTYAVAIASGKFAPRHENDSHRDYLPAGLLTAPDEWVEIDFHQPKLHEDIERRFITLHTRSYRGRSYFRVFCRFPGGRAELEDYLKYLDAEAVDWRFAANHGFIRLKADTRQIPVGTEVALVQSAIVLDDQLQPTPTRIVESVEMRVFLNVDGSDDPATNTGVGMNVYEYTFKRRLLFDGLRQGGLSREADDFPKYLVLFQEPGRIDWGRKSRAERLVQQCVNCHTGAGPGVHTIVSFTNSGAVSVSAQVGISHPVPAGQPSPRGPRAVKWKRTDETYRRLLETFE